MRIELTVNYDTREWELRFPDGETEKGIVPEDMQVGQFMDEVNDAISRYGLMVPDDDSSRSAFREILRKRQVIH